MEPKQLALLAIAALLISMAIMGAYTMAVAQDTQNLNARVTTLEKEVRDLRNDTTPLIGESG